MKTTRFTALAAATLLPSPFPLSWLRPDARWKHSFAATRPRPRPKLTNIVETAVAAGKFKTLIAAAKAAGLADVLQGERPVYRVRPDR